MISAWASKTYNDLIPFDRVIAVKDTGGSGISVYMEDKIIVTILPDEVPDFMEAFKAFIQISEAINLGVVPDDKPTKTKRPAALPLSSNGIDRRP